MSRRPTTSSESAARLIRTAAHLATTDTERTLLATLLAQRFGWPPETVPAWESVLASGGLR